MLFRLRLEPGVSNNGTEYENSGRWRMTDLVRWHEGVMKPIGGWRMVKGGSPLVQTKVIGKARSAHAWRDNSNQPYLVIGTHTGLFVKRPGTFAVVEITPNGFTAGRSDADAKLGFGNGLYGFSSYGTSRPLTTAILPATTWTLDNFGQTLLSMSLADNKLYQWDLISIRALQVPQAPTGNGVLVTDERFVVIYGAGGNPRLIQWSDQENFALWTPAATNQAGDFQLQTGGEILQALKMRRQTLFLTTEDAHAMTYIGSPLVHSFQRAGSGCGSISRQSGLAVDNFAVWMGQDGFYVYDGFTKSLPCPVVDYVFSRMSISQVSKVWATRNPNLNEVTWFYPSGTEIDSYVTWNYVDNVWSVGNMARTGGVDDSVLQYPIRFDADGGLYEHEVGFNYDGAMPYAETGPLELGEGENVYMARHLYPDERTQGDVQVRFRTRFYPNGPEYSHGPYQMNAPTSVRFTGRQVVMRVEGINPASWRFGVPRLEVVAGGNR